MSQRYKIDCSGAMIPNDTPEIKNNIDALQKLPPNFQAGLEPIYRGDEMNWEEEVELRGQLFLIHYDRLGGK